MVKPVDDPYCLNQRARCEQSFENKMRRLAKRQIRSCFHRDIHDSRQVRNLVAAEGRGRRAGTVNTRARPGHSEIERRSTFGECSGCCIKISARPPAFHFPSVGQPTSQSHPPQSAVAPTSTPQPTSSLIPCVPLHPGRRAVQYNLRTVRSISRQEQTDATNNPKFCSGYNRIALCR